MTAIEDARAALVNFDAHGVIFGPDVATALRALIAEHERLTTPPTDDEREALAAEMEAEADKWSPQWTPTAAILRKAATALRRQGPITDALQRAMFDVESKHHFHGVQCLCGFESHRSRSRTEHITGEVLAALEAAERAR